jgi:four helix bundle protein
VSERYYYRNLILWQRAQELAYAVIQITKRFPNTWASAIIARQVIASATSISANIAEGHGRFSIGAHRNHLSIARGSTAETDSWLDLMRREGLLDANEERQLHNRCRQVLAMITTKMKDLDAEGQSGDKSIQEAPETYNVTNTDIPSFPYVDDDYDWKL